MNFNARSQNLFKTLCEDGNAYDINLSFNIKVRGK